MEKILGIDLGTTNSEVALIIDGRPRVIEEDGEKILPSVVGLSPAGELLVGTPAKNQYVLRPEETIRSIKRKMGSNEGVSLGGRLYTPPEVSAIILKRLKQRAEKVLGQPFNKAVITVPAYFTDAQRQATKDAGEIAGLEVVRLLNEPTAAALAYGLDRDEDQHIVVYDLGGGTFDLSAIELNSGVIEVRSTHGNNHLGGDDFDAKIVDFLVDRFKLEHRIDLRADRRALARITRAAEQTKIELSSQPYARISEEFIATKSGHPLHLDLELSRHDFERMIQEYLGSTLRSIDIALRDAHLREGEIDQLLLVGGSTRIPAVSRLIEEKFGQPPHGEIDPDLCVALGAAIQGGIIAGEEVEAVLVDVAPFSLGTRVLAIDRTEKRINPDRFSVIIPRNTAIPTSKAEVYCTWHKDQKEVNVEVYQGESPRVSENTLLGEFLLRLKPGPAGKEIIVNFDYDINGIVQVRATEKETGKTEEITIDASRQRLSEEEKEKARRALSNLSQGSEPAAREVKGERPGLRERWRLKATLNRAQKLLPKVSEEENRRELQELIEEVKEAIASGGDRQELLSLNEVLLDLIYQLEG